MHYTVGARCTLTCHLKSRLLLILIWILEVGYITVSTRKPRHIEHRSDVISDVQLLEFSVHARHA
jgi:hypothetical protein